MVVGEEGEVVWLLLVEVVLYEGEDMISFSWLEVVVLQSLHSLAQKFYVLLGHCRIWTLSSGLELPPCFGSILKSHPHLKIL